MANHIHLLSHPAENGIPEKRLTDHLFRVAECCQNRVKELNLELTLISNEELARLSFLIGLFHDFGKATTFFQEYLLEPQRKADRFTRHSLFSAAICFEFVQREFPDSPWSYVAFQVIRRHHADLAAFDLSEEVDEVEQNLGTAKIQLKNTLLFYYQPLAAFYQEHVADFASVRDMDFNTLLQTVESADHWLDNFVGQDRPLRMQLFFTVNLLFSLLIDFDKKDAARLDSRYFAGNLEEPPNDVFAYLDHLRQVEPARFDASVPINGWRDSFLQEIQENPHISAQQHFYTLSAPTGIGKTFGCLAFANRLQTVLPGNQRRIIYCLPYTSIIDQNFQQFERIIRFHKKDKYQQRPTRYLLKHHYLTPKQVVQRLPEENYTYKDYLDDVLWVESWEAAFIVTTFVQFFHSVIGFKNRFLKKFHHIVNSIVILDEVQNIDPAYYLLLQQVLSVLGQRFGIYFLLCTATQPKILDGAKSPLVSLVDSARFMADPVFNRVVLRVRGETCTLNQFQEEFCRDFAALNGLVVMNTKKAAVQLYFYIKEYMAAQKKEYRVYCLTTLLTPGARRDKIGEIRWCLERREPVIVVATQLIEAGVDLSFQYVVRDFGPFDSIVQVAGRCNRHGEYGPLGGTMWLVQLLNEEHRHKPYYSYIYHPLIAQAVKQTLTTETYESKEFESLSRTYFDRLDFRRDSAQLLKALGNLNYDQNIQGETPVKDFKLIEEMDTDNLYLLITPAADQAMAEWITCRQRLRSGMVEEQEKDGLLLQIEKLKALLREFCITVREKDVAKYADTQIIQEEGLYRYICYKDCLVFAYDTEIGFLTEPKRK